MHFRLIGLLAALMFVALPGCSGTEEAETSEPGTESTGDSSTGDESSGAATTAPATDTSLASTGGSEPVIDTELRDKLVGGIEGIPVERLSEQVDAVLAGYAASPSDTRAVTQYIGMLQNLGMMQAQQGNKEAAHEAFRVSAAAVMQARKDDVKLMTPELAGIAHYNFACVLSSEGKVEEAVDQLGAAFKNGFTDFDQLEADSDLAPIRELADYQQKVDGWKADKMAQLQEHAIAELENGESFPFEFQLVNVVDGSPVDLSQHAGKVCIVDIWGTWCPPCRAEIPSFIKLQEKFGSEGFQMVGLNQEDGADDEERAKKVVDYITENDINYPCALISDDVLGSVPEFQGFPTTVFIDKSGKVRAKVVGLHEYEYLEAIVQVLLAEDGPQESTGD